MYDPTIGKWISEDPIGFEGGDANLTRYVGNAPTMLIDPTGTVEVLPPKFKKPPAPGAKTIDDLAEILGENNELVLTLREIKAKIIAGGGIVTMHNYLRPPEGQGYRCSEADGLVQEIMKKNRMSRKGWQYEHRENDGWFFDHNWGVIYDKDSDFEIVVDFWKDIDNPIYIGGEHPSFPNNANPDR